MNVKSKMTKEEILGIAREVAKKEKWAWLEPAEVSYIDNKGIPVWEVRTNTLNTGTNIRIVIDDKSGVVLEKGHLMR